MLVQSSLQGLAFLRDFDGGEVSAMGPDFSGLIYPIIGSYIVFAGVLSYISLLMWENQKERVANNRFLAFLFLWLVTSSCAFLAFLG